MRPRITKKPLLLIEQQGRFLAVAHSTGISASGTRGNRREITQFTRRSRKNLLDTIAKINPREALHIVLTYKENFDIHAVAAYDLRKFLAMVSRHTNHAPMLWRKELQKRGAIHFHVLVLANKYIDINWITKKWSEATEQQGGFCWVTWCGSARKVVNYVSKYVAKMPDVVPENDSSLDTPTNLHTGRWWGIVNRRNIDYPTKRYFALPGHADEKQPLKTWARYVRRIAPRNRVDFRRGWTLYLDGSQRVMWYLIGNLAFPDSPTGEISPPDTNIFRHGTITV